MIRAEISGRKEFLLILEHVLIPLLDQLGRVALIKTVKERREAATSLKVQTLNSLKEVTGLAAGKRATYFKLVRVDFENTLVSDKSTGMDTRPLFDKTTIEGRRALHVVETRESDYCHSVGDAPDDEIDKTVEHKYETFVSAAAFDGFQVNGLMTVDAPHKGDLQSVDTVVVRLLGTLVGISESLTRNS